jgi:uncharacterized protein (TIGR03790 family)
MLLKNVLLIVILALQAMNAFAGGSGLNLVVVVNQNSPNSIQLGNEYCTARGVPPGNLFRMTNWTGGSIAWSRSDFEGYLRNPLLAFLSGSGLTNQVSYVLLSMDIPYRVSEEDSDNSTTSALFYGFKTNGPVGPNLPTTCSLPDFSSNSFAFSELPFELAKPDTATTNSFLAFMLTDNTLAGAEAILARGLLSDSSFPTQRVYLEKTSDPARNVRFFSFDNARFDARIRHDPSVVRITSDSTTFESIRGLLTGFATLSLPGDAFVPGGLGDSLTSFAGALFDQTGQTPLLAFLDAGAAASYGTVTEPCNFLQKFPDPIDYIYQNRGFCAAESYYQSVLNPFQGLFVGEPLSAPFAAHGEGDWNGLTNGTLLAGQTSLPAATFNAARSNAPIAQVDLFVDGRFARTITNLVPVSHQTIDLSLNGAGIQYTIPEGTTLCSLVRDLAGVVNAQSNTTRIEAIPFGDRLELQSLDVATPGSNVVIKATSAPGSLVSPSSPQEFFLDTEATGYLVLTVTNATSLGDWLSLAVTKTNGTQISLSVTNSGSTNVADLCLALMNLVNATASLQDSDGIVAGELYPDVNFAQFILYARSLGWAAAQVQVSLTASPNLMVIPAGVHPFEDNISDLRPRNHLYAAVGLAQVSVSVDLNTSQLADGFHELTLVAYEGTSVRTQTHLSRTVQVRNTILTATLVPLLAGTNTTLEAPLSLTVDANGNNISTIELLSTGGSLGVVSNQATATFVVPTSFLGVGVHPFYAIVTDSAGHQFRTSTTSLQIVPDFALAISSGPLRLSWESQPGVSYDILSSTNLAAGFQYVDAITATGPQSQWVIPPGSTGPAFYRLRLSP